MICHVIWYNWAEYLLNVRVLLEEQLSKSLIGSDQYLSVRLFRLHESFSLFYSGYRNQYTSYMKVVLW